MNCPNVRSSKHARGEADFQVVGEARDGRECADLVRRERPRILLIKEDLPVMNG